MRDTTQAAFGEVADPAGVLSLIGEYDIFSSKDLESQLLTRLSHGRSLTLDLTRCTYIDSTILSVLVRVVSGHGDRLRMIVPSQGNVARILSVTQLDRYFPIVA